MKALIAAIVLRLRRPRTSLEFLIRHERTLRQLQAYEQATGRFSAWLSRAIEMLDEFHQAQAPRSR